MKSTDGTWLAALFAGILTTGLVATWPGAAAAEDVYSLEDLYFLEQAADRIRARLELLRGSVAASPEEVAEHERYLERLEAQIRVRRQAINALGTRPSARHSARRKSVVPPVGAPPKIHVVPEATEADDVAALDRKLHTSLGIFDEMLLQEVETATEESMAGAAAGMGSASGGMSGTGSSTGGPPGSTQRGSRTSSEGTTSSGTREQSSKTQAGVGAKIIEPTTEDKTTQGDTSKPGGRIPPDIPDGRDDDVVARQIREAAQAETDPALREKLWEEYRRYKRGSS